MVLQKDGVKITLTNEIQIAAFKKSGYTVAQDASKEKKTNKKED